LSSELVGQTIGRYRLDAFIGEGGMGRVFRGFDPTLGRAVAIKLLPEKVANDRDRLDRFVREARTASALNHPNVVTIYEIGSHNDNQYIAMELLEGETLRDRLTHGKLEIRRAIDIIGQIADGVAAAHTAGVIHRDLKPENVVLTKAGYVKILDFGLAKLRESPMAADDGATAKRTGPGTVLGSVGYMSPEQAAGREVDHRSDIFSIGCMLYEVLSGRRAFSGASSIDTLHKILHDDPAPLRDFTADLPPELQRIVRKCLAKEPDERYQSAKDLAIDLRSLRRDIDSSPRTASDAASKPKNSKAIIAAVIAVVVLAIAIAIPLFRKRTPAVPSAPMSITRLTASGNVIGATLSPNGEYLAYGYSDAGKHSLHLKQLATGSSLQLVPPAGVGIWGISFAPDSRSVFFAIKASTNPAGALYEIPILGGSPKLLLDRIDSSPSFSPDGKRVAFTRMNEPTPGHSAVVVANSDGSGVKVLASKALPASFAPIFWGAPAWSPDGKMIAAALNLGDESTLVGISVDDGKETRLTTDKWTFVGQAAWTHDMKSLILVAKSKDTPVAQIWELTYPDGHRRQITNDLFEYRMISLTSDDNALVSVAADQTGGTWLTPIDGSGKPVKVSAGKYDGLRGIAAGSDRFLISSRESGKSEITSIDRTGNDRKVISSADEDALGPALSPDGKTMVFTSPRQSDWVLKRANADGSNAAELFHFAPSGHPPGNPQFTADGKAVLVQTTSEGDRVYLVDIAGGTPKPLPPTDVYTAAISPDRKLLAYVAAKTFGLVIANVDTGAIIKTFSNISANTYSLLRWTPDGKAILHNAAVNDRKNVWIQPIDGSAAHPVTSFDDALVLGFDIVPGGKELAVVRGTLSRDAVMIKNFH
jgi:serine/threonine protein kinase